MKFRGKSRRNLDAKGRLMLSPEFRSNLLLHINSVKSQTISNDNPEQALAVDPRVDESMEIQFFITTFGGRLFAYPYHEYLAIEKELEEIPDLSDQPLSKKLLFVGNAEEHTVDSQGRILLSQDHREYAGIEKEVFVVGQLNHFEIWNPERYKQAIEPQIVGNVSTESAKSQNPPS